MRLTGAGKVGGVAGYPVTHSLSPLLHGHWLQEYDINGAYVPLRIAPEAFTSVVPALRQAGFSGINVTVPHKEAAFALSDTQSVGARAAGAANLLIFTDTGIHAENTDAPGLVGTLTAALGADGLTGKKAVILGAGGMARAAVLGLSTLGVDEIILIARRPAAAGVLAAAMQPVCAARIQADGFEGWTKAAADCALIVNATSAGMSGRPPLDLPLMALPPSAAVFDAVYNPLVTPLLADAAARGHKTIDGLWLLLHQAVPSFEALFGVRPQISPALRRLLEDSLHAA